MVAHLARMTAAAAERNKKNIVGHRFGRLVCKEVCSDDTRYALFDCDCGTKGHRVRWDGVKSGRVTGCGCVLKEAARERGLRFGPATAKNLLGRRFGRLEVLHRADPPEGLKYSGVWWWCRCDCGAEKALRRSSLLVGDTTSCGCAKQENESLRPEKAKQRSQSYARQRFANEPAFRLSTVVRTAINQSLRRRRLQKSGRTEEALGYTMQDLHRRLEETMPEGMDWDDFLAGRLEIDHIVGLEHFHYTSVDDPAFKAAWALSNLQLLTYEKHKAKSAEATRNRKRRSRIGDEPQEKRPA